MEDEGESVKKLVNEAVLLLLKEKPELGHPSSKNLTQKGSHSGDQ